MDASAKQNAELEEQLIHERSRVSNLSSKLERESERRETVQGELDKTKQVGRWFVCGTGRGEARGRRRATSRNDTPYFIIESSSTVAFSRPAGPSVIGSM